MDPDGRAIDVVNTGARVPARSLLIPMAVAAGTFAATYGWLASASLRVTDGIPIYPLDDTYIQMAIARTLAASGTYGFTPDVPAYSSSSPLWVLLLAAGAKLGLLARMPALLNIAAAMLVLYTSLRHLASRGLTTVWLTGAGVALNVLPPLAVTAAIGLEHVAHAWLSLVFAMLVCRVAGDAAPSRSRVVWLVVTAAVLVACRFEGLFLVGCGALMLARRRFLLAAAVAASALLPVGIHAAAALSQGWNALPAPLIIKGNYPAALSATAVVQATAARVEKIGGLLRLATSGAGLATLLFVGLLNALAVVLAVIRRRMGSIDARMPLLALGTFALHAMLAGIDRTFGRYETYLIVLGIVSALPWLHAAATRAPARARRGGLMITAGLVVIAAALAPMLWRSAALARRIPIGSGEIYLQQYQMGRFARAALAGETVVVNDLGLMTYGGGVRPVDAVGLGTIEIARTRKARALTPERLDAIARAKGAVAAMVNDPYVIYVAGAVPPSWIPIAQLVMPTQVVVAGRIVTIYALDAGRADRLGEDLRRFAPSLPAGASLVFLPPRS